MFVHNFYGKMDSTYRQLNNIGKMLIYCFREMDNTVDNKNSFSKWLSKQNKSDRERYKDSTLSDYISAVESATTEFKEELNPYDSFFGIDDADTLDKIIEKIKNTAKFNDFNNNRGNEDLSACLNLYERFLSEKKGYIIPYSSMLIESKNIIFRGAPGTGKSYLAKEIATDIISNGNFIDYTALTDEQREQVEFVQFHPSYDYTDFVEGLRPKINSDGSMGFELQDGVFKKFVARAKKNYEDSQKSEEELRKEVSAQQMIEDYLDSLDLDLYGSSSSRLTTVNGHGFFITGYDEKHIDVYIPDNETVKRLSVSRGNIQKMIESGRTFDKVKDVTEFFGKKFGTQGHSYELPICNAIQASTFSTHLSDTGSVELKKYVFIIDEINRGEMSKIFGELFFAIDPGYRGRAGEVSTQYSNLHDNPSEKFYIPDNVYIIGTMNDIDRSVDSFDFAMRRRFRFIELRADDHPEKILANLNNKVLEEEAKRRMSALNKEIANVEELNENYQIGAAYFLKLKTIDFDRLWTDYLQPLLQDYVQGMYDEKGIINKFARAYGYKEPKDGNANESNQD